MCSPITTSDDNSINKVCIHIGFENYLSTHSYAGIYVYEYILKCQYLNHDKMISITMFMKNIIKYINLFL